MKFKEYLTEAKQPSLPPDLKKAVKFIISKGFKFHSTEKKKSGRDTNISHRYVNSDKEAIEFTLISSEPDILGWAAGSLLKSGRFDWDDSGADSIEDALDIVKNDLEL